MRLLAIIAAVALMAVAGCAGHDGGAAAPSRAATGDPRTVAALLRIATAFNNDYDSGDYGPVYDQWDARSQAIISKADYVRRHTDCPTAPHVPANVDSARPGPGGAWLVTYEISGVRLTDYWFYQRGRWLFDLVLSNPDAVRLYKLSSQRYASAVGCAH